MSLTLYEIVIGGRNISADVAPILEEIHAVDGTDNEADSASIVLSDMDGHVAMSKKRDPVSIKLGTPDLGVGLVFQGFVDDVRSKGDRSGGRKLFIECKSVDLGGRSKETREKHWENKTVKEVLKDAFSQTGISIEVSPELASVKLDYEAMDSEDPLSFAARLASEVGGTFKMMGERAVLTKRNSGTGINGSALPLFEATYGVNLISWDISPIISRASFGGFQNRWFDFDKNKLETEEEESTGESKHRRSRIKHSKDGAKQLSGADKIDSERKEGEGSVVVTGTFLPQAEGRCKVAGAREGVDGTYAMSQVEHSLTRSDGWTVTLELKQPQGGAGSDSRLPAKSSIPEPSRVPIPTPAPR